MEKPKDSKYQCEKPKAFNTRMVWKLITLKIGKGVSLWKSQVLLLQLNEYI